jgi:hypothetical protein
VGERTSTARALYDPVQHRSLAMSFGQDMAVAALWNRRGLCVYSAIPTRTRRCRGCAQGGTRDRSRGQFEVRRYHISQPASFYAENTRPVDPCQIHCEANFSPWLPIPSHKRAEISRRSVHPAYDLKGDRWSLSAILH